MCFWVSREKISDQFHCRLEFLNVRQSGFLYLLRQEAEVSSHPGPDSCCRCQWAQVSWTCLWWARLSCQRHSWDSARWSRATPVSPATLRGRWRCQCEWLVNGLTTRNSPAPDSPPATPSTWEPSPLLHLASSGVKEDDKTFHGSPPSFHDDSFSTWSNEMFSQIWGSWQG